MKAKHLRRTGRSDKAARHVRLHHWMMDTAAWQSLGALERGIYVEICRRYGGQGTNNGRIPYSIREAADTFKVGKSTAARALVTLQEHGFVAVARKGHFDRKVKHASEWRLTEFVDDVTGELPTKEFLCWQPVPASHSQKPVPVVGPTVPVVGPIGTCGGTVPFQNARFGT